MFGKQQVAAMIERSAENDNDRRNFLKGAGLAASASPAPVRCPRSEWALRQPTRQATLRC
jgi:hypothetical protein